MARPGPPPTASSPRWDGARVLFEVQDGGRSVSCAISLNALQDLSERRSYRPLDLLNGFAAARDRIEAIALGKIRTRPDSVCGLLNIWSDDIDPAPAADRPTDADKASSGR